MLSLGEQPVVAQPVEHELHRQRREQDAEQPRQHHDAGVPEHPLDQAG